MLRRNRARSTSFLSTPSGWRATDMMPDDFCSQFISIHALRVEGDAFSLVAVFASFRFLSTPSGWRATPQQQTLGIAKTISIHALRVEGDKTANLLRR